MSGSISPLDASTHSPPMNILWDSRAVATCSLTSVAGFGGNTAADEIASMRLSPSEVPPGVAPRIDAYGSGGAVSRRALLVVGPG